MRYGGLLSICLVGMGIFAVEVWSRIYTLDVGMMMPLLLGGGDCSWFKQS